MTRWSEKQPSANPQDTIMPLTAARNSSVHKSVRFPVRRAIYKSHFTRHPINLRPARILIDRDEERSWESEAIPFYWEKYQCLVPFIFFFFSFSSSSRSAPVDKLRVCQFIIHREDRYWMIIDEQFLTRRIARNDYGATLRKSEKKNDIATTYFPWYRPINHCASYYISRWISRSYIPRVDVLIYVFDWNEGKILRNSSSKVPVVAYRDTNGIER